ncbi:hypothetical protein Sjap_017348 [Stephania japonica]|uniref:Uncharacterized protein n=1 Tax=Stephania japonica TaxID=461633 RepID=A0AAP0I605_9MAGN
MPLVTLKHSAVSSPLLANRSLRRYPGNISHPYSSRNWHLASSLMRSNIQFHPLRTKQPHGRSTWMLSSATMTSSNNIICRAAQTQTVERRSSSTAGAPGKEKLPMLDDGSGSGIRGTGYTPYYRGDDRGGGGGSGGGGRFSLNGGFPWGDFWFFMFLLLLRFVMMNVIQEGHFSLKNKTGKKKPIRRYL